MKNEHDTFIKEKALQIAQLEQEILLGKNVQENQNKIEYIMSTLSIEDIFLIDEYISENKILANKLTK